MKPATTRAVLLGAASLATLCTLGHAARADDAGRLNSIEHQIQELQAQLHRMQHDLAVKNRQLEAAQSRGQAEPGYAPHVAVPPAVPPGFALVATPQPGSPGSLTLVKVLPPAKPLPPGTVDIRGVRVTLGGFISADSIYRSRNEVADIGSSYGGGIPLPNSPLYHQHELRFTARATRISLNAAADPDSVTHLDAYGETDFQGTSPTSNSTQSNSYTLRLRLAYLQYERSDYGLHLLAGQDWSLITMAKTGLSGGIQSLNIPVVIDTSYVPGFTWTRQPQLRIAKDFGKKLWLALSIENPQTNYYAGANGALPSTSGTATTSSPGGNLFPSTVNFSDEAAPDIIGKVAYDMKLAHLEAYGLLRFPTDRITNHGLGDNHTEVAGGAGAAAIIHVIPKVLDIQGSGLIGKGIGRYGSAQLPDAVVDSDGHPRPLREFEALAGLIAHPTPIVDLYAYGGVESVDSHAYTSAGKGYGYGSTLYINTGCETELSTACVANTSRVEQATVGGYFKALHSKDYGSVQLGMQYSYTHRAIFGAVGPTPKSNVSALFFEVRYFPFADNAPDAPPRL